MSMSRRRARFKTFDQRTGRLERAVSMIEDGETGMLVRKGENDRAHPLSQKFVPPIDRASILGTFEPEPMRGDTILDVGYDSVGSNFERPMMPVISIPTTGGTFVYSVGEEGYGEGGFGEFGYGGYTVIDGEGDY